jgi:Asp-tRNA(Asn)/Glu-tRNA(Gln) amidotransferase A subunit family amidase
LSIRAILEGYKTGTVTPKDVAQICFDQIEKYDPQYLAMECFEPEKLFAEAACTQKYLDSGKAMRDTSSFINYVSYAIAKIFR